MADATLRVRVQTPTYYVYKCTTQQLEDALNHIVECGDQIVQPAFCGGRDWIIVCIRAANIGDDYLTRKFAEPGRG